MSVSPKAEGLQPALWGVLQEPLQQYANRTLSLIPIAIALPFCSYEWDNKTHFETGEVLNGDSKLLTLIHEITHFDDTFSSNDEWYGTMISKLNATDPKNRAKARVNADNIAAYILGIDQETAA